MSLENVRQKESSYYKDEDYFIGTYQHKYKVTIALTDDTEFEEYGFWLIIDAVNSDDSNEVSIRSMADEIARKLICDDNEVVLLEGPDTDSESYLYNKLNNRIVVTKRLRRA